MTRIDFHSNVPDKLQYACRLARKALSANLRVVLLAKPAELDQLDLALWSFADDSFLPHVKADDALAARTPIVLASSEHERDSAELPHFQVLINLTDATPAHFARFERMFEVISSDDAEKDLGRERYRFYKQRGYPLSHHVAEAA